MSISLNTRCRGSRIAVVFHEQAEQAKEAKEQAAADDLAEPNPRAQEKNGIVKKTPAEEEAERIQAEETAKQWAKGELQRASTLIEVSSLIN